MKLTISIPKPCHEDWSAMTPQTNGRHCASCAITVADFSRLSDAQLIARFEQGDMPKCARFNKDQLDRVMSKPAEPAPNLLAAAATGAALMLVAPELAAQQVVEVEFGQPVITQPRPVEAIIRSEVAQRDSLNRVKPVLSVLGVLSMRDFQDDNFRNGDPRNEKMILGDTIITNAVNRLKPEDIAPLPRRASDSMGAPIDKSRQAEPCTHVITGGPTDHYGDVPWTNADVSTISGRVIDENKEPIPFASLVWTNGELAGATDFDGRFSIRRTPPHRDQNLRVIYVGYRPREVALPTSSQACEGTTIFGDAVDAHGKPMPGVVVQIEALGISCTTDEQGRFAFDLPNEDLPEHILLQAKGLVGLGGNVSIASASLPQCVQLVMNGDAKHTQLQAKDIDLGDIVMDNAEIFMGEVVIMEPFASKAKRRIVRPFRWMGKQIAKPFR